MNHRMTKRKGAVSAGVGILRAGKHTCESDSSFVRRICESMCAEDGILYPEADRSESENEQPGTHPMDCCDGCGNQEQMCSCTTLEKSEILRRLPNGYCDLGDPVCDHCYPERRKIEFWIDLYARALASEKASQLENQRLTVENQKLRGGK